MKKILLLTAIMFSFNLLFSQTSSLHTSNIIKHNSTVPYYKWSDPTAYKTSPSPIIKGYGYYSDSLSNMFDGTTFFEHNSEYFAIESWADYYYWFVQEYSYAFEDPQLYEYYYWAKDDYGMASYIASEKYLGRTYPSSIQIAFGDRIGKENRLDPAYDVEIDEKEIKQLEKQLTNLKEAKDYDTKPTLRKPEVIQKENDRKPTLTKPEVFQKENFRKSTYKNTVPSSSTKSKKGSAPGKK